MIRTESLLLFDTCTVTTRLTSKYLAAIFSNFHLKLLETVKKRTDSKLAEILIFLRKLLKMLTAICIQQQISSGELLSF